MSKLTLFLVLFLVFSIWRTKKAFTAIGDWHQINAHAGEGKQPLPETIGSGLAIWASAMIACSLALVVHGTMIYYADRSYDTFSRMAPVYPGARPVEDGFGISTSLDQKFLIVEYVFTDSWNDVIDYYTNESNSNGWRLSGRGDARQIFLEHRDSNILIISRSEPARYKQKGQRILKYTLYRKNWESKELKPNPD